MKKKKEKNWIEKIQKKIEKKNRKRKVEKIIIITIIVIIISGLYFFVWRGEADGERRGVAIFHDAFLTKFPISIRSKITKLVVSVGHYSQILWRSSSEIQIPKLVGFLFQLDSNRNCFFLSP